MEQMGVWARWMVNGAVLLFVVLIAYSCSLAGAVPEQRGAFAGRPEVNAFVSRMVARHHFDRRALDHLFARATPQPSILKTMAAPAGKAWSWYRYRRTFVNQRRITGGTAFWNEYRANLDKARQVFGVPNAIVVAIIGVETRYGRHVGGYRVFNVLSTLAFDYPPRAAFFRRELEHFLVLARDAGANPLSIRGSYAGAMGIPQFMPSSFLRFAVDFDGDGRRNVWTDKVDTIGSVANYLQRYGWRAGGPVAVRAEVRGDRYQRILDEGIKPRRTVAALEKLGITPATPVPSSQSAALIALKGKDGMQYWLIFHNFYVITRYNRSVKYAMAVYQLAHAIDAARRQAAVKPTALLEQPLARLNRLLANVVRRGQ